MRRLMYPRRRRFYKYFLSVVVLLVLCSLLQIFSVSFIDFSAFSTQTFFAKGSLTSRTRGVRKADIQLYISNDANSFKCKDGSAVIRLGQVNDDYCDCEEDGSDEPGTEACPNGKFFCLPEEKYMPSSRVNDGICDCCDGSDEWKIEEAPSSGGNIRDAPCIDVCHGIYIALSKKEKIKEAGLKVKGEFLEAGKQYIDFQNGLYGKDGEFYLLSQECFYYRRNKIMYTLCPFKENMQESNGRAFLIGKGGTWETNPINGEPVLVMDGGEGSRCTDRKSRQTKIYFICGTKNEILTLTEDEICVYAFHLSTPAAC